MDFINAVVDSYMTTTYDERTVNWWPVKYEWTMYAMFVGYLYFVVSWGPKFMENRRAYSLKTFIKYYNIFQIIYNGWIVFAAIKYGMFSEIGIGCVLIDRSKTGHSMDMANLFYWVLILKIIDMVETVVFVLRKKQRQVSFLHVYHHISTIYITQMSVKFFPGGMAAVPMVINSTIHVMMYSYYYLSSMGPKVQRVINPFKPYITIAQMVQFFFLLGHTGQTFLPNYCPVPKWGAIVMFFNLVMNFALFYNFYRKNYKNVEKPKKS